MAVICINNIYTNLMIKVWLLLFLTSVPNLPSVKYNAWLYKTEVECREAQVEYSNLYESQSDFYKSTLITDAFCIEFESFPIEKFQPQLFEKT